MDRGNSRDSLGFGRSPLCNALWISPRPSSQRFPYYEFGERANEPSITRAVEERKQLPCPSRTIIAERVSIFSDYPYPQ